MTATPGTVRARRYPLAKRPRPSARSSRRVLGDEEAVDRIAAAEDDLIENHLANALSGAERERFERVYLAAPHHRVRIETVKRLIANAPGVQVLFG